MLNHVNVISNLVLLQVLLYLHDDVLLVEINDGGIKITRGEFDLIFS